MMLYIEKKYFAIFFRAMKIVFELSIKPLINVVKYRLILLRLVPFNLFNPLIKGD